MDRDSLELLLKQGLSLGQIGRRFGRDPSTVGYWVKKHGLEAVNADKHAGKGGLARDDLERLVQEGLSVSQIAGRRHRSDASGGVEVRPAVRELPCRDRGGPSDARRCGR